jgi:hypothetical protein
MVGRWTTWNDAGHQVCEAQFATLQQRPLSLGPPPVTSLVRGDWRHGTAIWWDAADTVPQKKEYRDDCLVAGDDVEPAVEALAAPGGLGYQEQCTAIRRLRYQGSAGVPALLILVAEAPPPIRRRALGTLELIGPPAAAAVEPLAQIALAADDPLAIDATCALVAIDPTNRQRWLSKIIDAAVQEDPSLANDLLAVVFDRPHTIAADLSPHVGDSRRAVRQLCAAILLHALKQVTHPAKSPSPAAAWQPAEFQFGPLVWSPETGASWQQIVGRHQQIAAPVIELLDRMASDADGGIHTAVNDALHRVRAGELIPGFIK